MFVFYAFPFAQLCNTSNGQVEQKYRSFFDGLKDFARENNFAYILMCLTKTYKNVIFIMLLFLILLVILWY